MEVALDSNGETDWEGADGVDKRRKGKREGDKGDEDLDIYVKGSRDGDLDINRQRE